MTLAQLYTLVTDSIDTTGRRLTTGVKMRAVLNGILDYLTETSENCECVRMGSVIIETADVLTIGATPVPLGLTVPSNTFPDVITAKCFRSDVPAELPYTANTVIAIRCVGADDPLFTLDFLATTDAGAGGKYMERFISTTATSKQIIDGADLEIYAVGGNPSGGTASFKLDIMFNYSPA
jgi:hypothetical protein